MKIQIEKIYRNWEKKDGTKLIDNYGKPYSKITIQTPDGEYYSCLDFKGQTKSWAEGQTIDVEVVEKDGFKNIVLPKVGSASNARLDDIEKRLRVIEEKLGIPTHGTLEFKSKDKDFKGISKLSEAESGGDVDVNIDDLPF